MTILITAGNTQSPIDRVRCITNIFSGRTGAAIAGEAARRGHAVTLLTSHPETAPPDVRVVLYRTYDELEEALCQEITDGSCRAVVMAAAVNDYHVVGSYALTDQTRFDDATLRFDGPLTDARREKIKGNHREVWLRMIPAPKLIDRIRSEWGFTGTLVKFKLEVGVPEKDLIAIAEASRNQSRADWIVANTLDGKDDWAIILGESLPPSRVSRSRLAGELLDRLDKTNT